VERKKSAATMNMFFLLQYQIMVFSHVDKKMNILASKFLPDSF